LSLCSICESGIVQFLTNASVIINVVAVITGAAPHAGRLTSDRITRSQTQFFSVKNPDTSAKRTAAKVGRSKLVKATAEMSSLKQRSVSPNCGRSKKGQSQFSVVNTCVQGDAHVEDMEVSPEQTNDRARENVREEDDVFLDSDHVAVEVLSAENHQGIQGEVNFGGSSTGTGELHKAHIEEERLCHGDGSKPELVESFTPGRPRRARSTSTPSLTFSSIRKTPKNLRNSLLLRRMSPEEG